MTFCLPVRMFYTTELQESSYCPFCHCQILVFPKILFFLEYNLELPYCALLTLCMFRLLVGAAKPVLMASCPLA